MSNPKVLITCSATQQVLGQSFVEEFYSSYSVWAMRRSNEPI